MTDQQAVIAFPQTVYILEYAKYKYSEQIKMWDQDNTSWNDDARK